jgi:hypothetical protein
MNEVVSEATKTKVSEYCRKNERSGKRSEKTKVKSIDMKSSSEATKTKVKSIVEK